LASFGASGVHIHPLDAIESDDRDAISMPATHGCQAVSYAAAPFVPFLERESLVLIFAAKQVRIVKRVLTENRSHMYPLADHHEILLENDLSRKRAHSGSEPTEGVSSRCRTYIYVNRWTSVESSGFYTKAG
jgi:hypothetical protein